MKQQVMGLTVKQAARRIGIASSTVYGLIDRGKLRVLTKGQPRSSGRFAGSGMVLDPEDVEREREARR